MVAGEDFPAVAAAEAVSVDSAAEVLEAAAPVAAGNSRQKTKVKR